MEVRDVLGARGNRVGRVEVVPDVVHAADRDPMVTLVTNEPLTCGGKVSLS